jgi:hypothetical protein
MAERRFKLNSVFSMGVHAFLTKFYLNMVKDINELQISYCTSSNNFTPKMANLKESVQKHFVSVSDVTITY